MEVWHLIPREQKQGRVESGGFQGKADGLCDGTLHVKCEGMSQT